MAPRTLLVGLIVLATAAFVVGTVIERNSTGESGHHDETALPTAPTGESGASAEAGNAETGGESAATHAKENTATSTATTEEPHAELRPLGIDLEAWPFVTLAAVTSLTLAVAAWLRPRAVALLTLVAVAMLAFAALDIREVVHQLDINNSALAAMAGAIAALHLAAVATAAVIASCAGRQHTERPGSAGTMPA
jgi:hypothetical protein